MNFEALMRALLYIATMVLVGMPITLWTIGRPVLPARLLRVALAEGMTLLRMAAAGSALASAGLLAAQVAPLELDWSSGDAWRATLTEAVFGQMAVARIALGGALLAALFVIRDPGVRLVIAPIVGLLMFASIVRTSHTMAMEGGWRALLSNYAHLAGGALWSGGLITLVLCSDAIADDAEATAETSSCPAALVARLISRFSPFGMMAVTLVTGTGLLVAATHVTSVEVLREPGYGRTLLIKIAVVALAVLFAGYHKFAAARSMRTGGDMHRFRCTLWIELLIVLFVFFLAGVLASQSMPGAGHGHGAAASPTLAGYTLPMWVEIAALALAVAALCAALIELRARLR